MTGLGERVQYYPTNFLKKERGENLLSLSSIVQWSLKRCLAVLQWLAYEETSDSMLERLTLFEFSARL